MPDARAGLRLAEVTCWLLGAIVCGFFVAQLVQGEVRRLNGIDWADQAWVAAPDQTLWSESRIRAWQDANRPISGSAAQGVQGAESIVAVLEIPGLDLQVPVFAGDSDRAMDRGAGWIEGTATPGDAGNVGIAGHRDGYFRALKDARAGDAITLRTAQGSRRYLIDDIQIVDPLDVEVLDPTDEQVLTLVTCYPFYYLGSAPQRYIVRARLDTAVPANLTYY